MGNVNSCSVSGQDENIGSSQETEPVSASRLLSTLAPVAVYALIWLALFVILRRVFVRQYQARSVLNTLKEHERSPQLPPGLFSWIAAFVKIPDSYVLTHHSLDGYLFLRLLKMAVISCFVGFFICAPVLFPVNITGGGGQSQLDVLNLSNVSNNYYRYFAHAGCAYLFFGFIMFMITRESIFYINLRQAFLMSPLYAKRLSSRTVLFTSVPEYYLHESRMRDLLGDHVKRVWLPTDTKDLEEKVEERDKIAMKLEGAETKLCKLVNAAKLKSEKAGGAHEEELHEINGRSETGSVAARWIKAKDRPTHRLKPIIGKKVDTIDWSRAQLEKLIPEIEKEQHEHRNASAKKINSVFVEFDTIAEAQAAFQSLTHHQALHMSPRYTGIIPSEIIWSNLRIKWWERVIRVIATTGFVTALVVFWSVPVAFVGAISNVQALTCIIPALDFINDIPTAIRGVVTGLLPVILLAVLMALLPIILRLVAKLSGDPTRSAVELSVQNYYFAFQVVQVFLVATLGSAAASAVGDIIAEPTGIPSKLATTIPTASGFYLSYFVLQGLGVVSGLLVGLVGLVVAKVLGKLLDSTPRKMYKRWISLSGLGWGTVFPVYTNLFVIAICYACIAPLVLLFAAIGMWFFYFAYRYNLLFVYDINIDTKGLVYPRALQQLFVGLYIAEACLTGLFAIQLGSVGALGPFILMLVLLIFTVLYHASLNAALTPLLQYLPKSLQEEERRLLAEESDLPPHERADAPTKGYEKGTAEEEGISEARLAPHGKPGMIKKFLRPDIYTDYPTMRRMVPRNFADPDALYAPEVERDAYFHPAITSEPPMLWIPRDSAGCSRQEVQDTGKIIAITDTAAHFDEKNKISWDPEAEVPIAEPKIYY
ncbi:uncharacterized protein LTHEOB_8265 [Neofusicoccum parvum]|uniref:Uncharacterized protein LTHEOB_8265 n=2 Tax=Neofusicoccum parvum TaxID=310453 RepID=A0ACB5RVU6_9PEZI|nr:putative duf221 domain protein [Neofusicoccum parvum UCRNP2]GME24548.1 uncharacterized protein LTHEOB_8265 [Neofusicoccum parvum]GME43412.1 uncharacterized protein LTHEOB_8265 [Neofusicoccum parvum]